MVFGNSLRDVGDEVANRRMISKSISISRKVNSISDFAKLLFTWMIPHTDDFGRIDGNPEVIKALVIPMTNHSIEQVEQALAKMADVGLIHWYEVRGVRALEIANFDRFQDGLQKKTASRFPSRDGSLHLSATEEQIEGLIFNALDKGEWGPEGKRLIQVQRQVRIENKYMDIVCHDEDGHVYVFEIKRQRLNDASADQLLGYLELLKARGQNDLTGILIGYGLADNFKLARVKEKSLNIVTYDDGLKFTPVLLSEVKLSEVTLHNTLSDVMPRYPMLPSNRTEEKRTELKGREEKKLPNGSLGHDARKSSRRAQLTDEEFFASLKQNPAYEGIDIDRESAKIDAWLQTPQGQRRQKTRGFVLNWLNRIDKPMSVKENVGMSREERLRATRELLEKKREDRGGRHALDA